MKSFDSFTVSQLHQAIAQGEISATEIATSTLDAVEQANPVINAWTQITGDRMLSEAAKVDKSRASGAVLPPLAGIPYAVKNLLDVAGEVTLAGLRQRGHDVELLPDFSEAVGHAGAIVRHTNGMFEGASDPRSNGSAAGF